jgi:hypothetical protein
MTDIRAATQETIADDTLTSAARALRDRRSTLQFVKESRQSPSLRNYSTR